MTPYSFAPARPLPSRYLDALADGRLAAVGSRRFAELFDVRVSGEPQGAPFGFHFVRLAALDESSSFQAVWRDQGPDDRMSGTNQFGGAPGRIDCSATVILGLLDIDLPFVWDPAHEAGPVYALQDPPGDQPSGSEWAPHWIEISPSLDDFLDRLLE